MTAKLKLGSAARKRTFSGEMAGVFPLAGVLQLTPSGRRLIRVPPFATAGFFRTHLSTLVCQRTAILFFAPLPDVSHGVWPPASSLNQHPEFTLSRNRRVEK